MTRKKAVDRSAELLRSIEENRAAAPESKQECDPGKVPA
jgi:hypothetical protein